MGCGGSKDKHLAADQSSQPEEEEERPDSGSDALTYAEKKEQGPEEAKRQADRKEAKKRRAEEKAKKSNNAFDGYTPGKKKNKKIMFNDPRVGGFAAQTGADTVEAGTVYDQFKAYMTEKGIDQIDLEGFLVQLKELDIFSAHQDLARRLFKAMDTSGDGLLDLGELCAGLSVFNKGDKKAKLKLCFDAYDEDNDGGVEKSELKAILLSQVRASLNATAMAIDAQDEFDDLLDDSGAGGGGGLKSYKSEKFETIEDPETGDINVIISTPIGPAKVLVPKDKAKKMDGSDPFVALEGEQVLNNLVDDVFKRFDKDDNGSIGFDEFEMFVAMNPQLKEWFDFLDDSEKVLG